MKTIVLTFEEWADKTVSMRVTEGSIEGKPPVTDNEEQTAQAVATLLAHQMQLLGALRLNQKGEVIQ